MVKQKSHQPQRQLPNSSRHAQFHKIQWYNSSLANCHNFDTSPYAHSCSKPAQALLPFDAMLNFIESNWHNSSLANGHNFGTPLHVINEKTTRLKIKSKMTFSFQCAPICHGDSITQPLCQLINHGSSLHLKRTMFFESNRRCSSNQNDLTKSFIDRVSLRRQMVFLSRMMRIFEHRQIK